MKKDLNTLVKERILILDGAMGTMIQHHPLTEEDYRGKAFRKSRVSLKGCNDLLSVTRPDIIHDIHSQYLRAGADIIETNTFSANRISLADYALEDQAYLINSAAAKVARQAADAVSSPGKPRFVAGSMGPTNRTASLSPDVLDPGFRAVTFDGLYAAYKEQATGLLDGGVDLLIVETIFDTLNAKAALIAIFDLLEERKKPIPVIASLTISDQSGRNLSGQTPEAFLCTIAHFDLFAVGLNCSLGPKEIRPCLETFAAQAPFPVAVYPNAGLPDEFGLYGETPESMASTLSEFMRDGLVNLAGGCCGTTPGHISALAGVARNAAPRPVPLPGHDFRLSGLEPLSTFPGSNFINIGERTNVSGSRKFARLIREERYEEALSVARQQVESGAQVLDISMDEAMLDAEKAMVRFLHLAASDPDIARVPFMIDSSKWEVITAALKCIQGKPVVNSVSLKEGEDKFREHAALLKKFGAAVVVMAFDEQGQAATFERKTTVAERAYQILVRDLHYPPEDVILDPNVLTISTGIEEHNSYAVDFIRAVKWIKAHLPYARVSGGISNLSFAFRGNEYVREAMHTVFLYHAVRAGLDMGIVNAGNLMVYDEIPPDTLKRVEDVVLNRSKDATERLIAFASQMNAPDKEKKDTPWRSRPADDRLEYALIRGIDEFVEEDVDELLVKYDQALKIIEGPLMKAMNKVGDLFGSGKMFLPQVVRSARVMKKAVTRLTPRLEAEKTNGGGAGNSKGRILLATVRGDVHDIGKNIAGVVLGCNHYDIIDLGVMVPAGKIIREAKRSGADVIGLSGLITPSLDEMVHVAKEMQREHFEIPLLIGGATTSDAHTAVKIAPHYEGTVIHVRDASQAAGIVSRILSTGESASFREEIRNKQEEIRIAHEMKSGDPCIPIQEARKNRLKISWQDFKPPRPHTTGILYFYDFPLEELIPFIDWNLFFHAWRIKGRYPSVMEDPVKGPEARKLMADAKKMLGEISGKKMVLAKGAAGIFPCNSAGDDIRIYADENRNAIRTTLHFLRNQQKKVAKEPNLCLADFIAPQESGIPDYIGAFAVTTGLGVEEWVSFYEQQLDDYHALLIKILADRLAEAFAERLHQLVKTEYWGYDRDGKQGIRPAPGYPACPDHSEKETLFDLLEVSSHIDLSLTETYMMYPAASVAGYYLSHPATSYFQLGKIGNDQLADYAKRKNISFDRIEKLLRHHPDSE